MKQIFMVAILAGVLSGAVDINSANETELATLRDIGEKKAAAIVEYRKKNGCFKDLEAFKDVKGVNKKTISKNEGNIIVGKCKK